MGILVGRDAELARGRAVLDSSAKGRYVRALRIVGVSGTGKTALAQALALEARTGGWLVAEVPSFRIHATLPLFAARRAVQALLDALGPDAAPYESGLSVDRDRPEDFEEAFLRLVEGITLDHRVLLVLDDAQWADGASRDLIARTATALADRSIVLLSTERSDELSEPAFALADEAIALSDLSPQAAVTIVRSIYADVNDEVARTIAAATRGHAMDLVAVATAARENGATTVREVSESTRRVVARDLALLDPGERTFLQICALIDEPIGLPLLQQLWPKDQLLEMIAHVSGRYLLTQQDGLRFVHATIMESVLETIPIEIPLRYRVIEAIKKLPSPQLEDYERLAKQSAACGDRDLERETLMKLADEAAARAMTSLAIDATERALEIRQPANDELPAVYTRLSHMYNLMGRELESIRACQNGLAQASAAGITEGLGGIVASMIVALAHAGRTQDARHELHRYEAILTAPPDRAQLISAGAYLAMNRCDEQEFDRLRAAFAEFAGAASPMVVMRRHTTSAFFEMRRGNEASALEELRAADRACQSLPPFVAVMSHASHTLYSLHFGGVTAAERECERFELGPHDPPFQLLRPHLLLARGEFEDAAEFALDLVGSVRDPLLRRSLLGALATASALREAPATDPAWRLVEAEAAIFESGSRASSLWPVAAAWALAGGRQAPKRATLLIDQLIIAFGEAPDYGVLCYPVVLALAARAVNDRAALAALAAWRDLWMDHQPWSRAQRLLAQGLAAHTLGLAEGTPLLNDAADQFDTLGAPFFAHYARRHQTGEAPKAESKERFSNTTRREREIAALVAEGLTNRQVAEKLVLSERTVEGHIANLFAKVNVNSRTQLAAWYLRTASSVA